MCFPFWHGEQILADLTAFSYFPGTSLLHILDVRFKLVILFIISTSVLKAYPLALFVLTLMIIGVSTHARLPVKTVFKELRYFFILLFIVFAARVLFTPGSPLFKYKAISVSHEGIHDGVIVCWRLLIVIMIGIFFIITTRPSEVKKAVEWFLIPFPFIPRQRVATMISLIIRFVPVIVDQAKN